MLVSGFCVIHYSVEKLKSIMSGKYKNRNLKKKSRYYCYDNLGRLVPERQNQSGFKSGKR